MANPFSAIAPSEDVESPASNQDRRAGTHHVQVNVRNLVQHTLSRYPVDFGLLRELIQNADDAGATRVKVSIRTTMRDSRKLRSISVSNDGKRFSGADWKNLVTIAQVNDQPNRVGIFGVGFFSVFRLSERPSVHSGNKRLDFKGYSDHSICHSNIQDCAPPETPWKTVVHIPVDNPASTDAQEYVEQARRLESNRCLLVLVYRTLICRSSPILQLAKLQLFLTRPLLLSKRLEQIELFKDDALVVDLAAKLLPNPQVLPKLIGMGDSPWTARSACIRELSIQVVRGAGPFHAGSENAKAQLVSVELDRRLTAGPNALYAKVEQASSKVR